MNEIKYPETTKYAIVQNDEKFVGVIITPEQVLSTNNNIIKVFDTFDDAQNAYSQLFILTPPVPTPLPLPLTE